MSGKPVKILPETMSESDYINAINDIPQEVFNAIYDKGYRAGKNDFVSELFASGGFRVNVKDKDLCGTMDMGIRTINVYLADVKTEKVSDGEFKSVWTIVEQ